MGVCAEGDPKGSNPPSLLLSVYVRCLYSGLERGGWLVCEGLWVERMLRRVAGGVHFSFFEL